MTAPPPPRRLLTSDSRRSLALLAGGDLASAEASAAQTLADDCPHCRGHLASVRGGLDALRRCEPAEQPGGLWESVRGELAVATPAAEPARSRPWVPAFAVTAAALLAGLFAFGPTAGEVLPGLFDSSGVVRPVAEEAPAYAPDRRPSPEELRRFRQGDGRGTLDRPRVEFPR